ncbi:unnamed protein product [Ceratitis capitata]|uniref:(Mediterranean fruit fly) hypothetical protein n=1 Tax=Ceratitis capitata TaxID=7213 RepID=A0A811UPR4_CERCA|nr:unnamed protein product [Ceratitis capitata]
MEFSTTYAYTFKQKRSSLCMHRLKPQLVVGGQQQHHHQRHHPLHNKPREVTQKSTNECKLAGNECGAVISEKHSSVDREQGKRNVVDNIYFLNYSHIIKYINAHLFADFNKR